MNARATGPSQAADVFFGLLLDHVDDIVVHDYANQPSRLVGNRRRSQIVLLEDVGDFFLIHIDGDDPRIGLHDVTNRNRASRPQQYIERQGTDRMMIGIDKNQFIEVVR